MPIPGLTLDDLTWSGMLDAIRRRIPALSRGDWTLHAPVDPGITLLEVYAWLLEQRVFWLDQIPDSFVRAALRLLGIRSVGTIAGRTVLQLAPTPGVAALPGLPALVSQGTVFEVEDSNPPIRATTHDAVFLVDVASAVISGQIDVTSCAHNTCLTLDDRSPLPLFSTDGSEAEVEFAFQLRSAPQAPAGARMSLFVDLDVAPAIAPQWDPTAARDAPQPADVTWSYNGASGRTAFEVDTIRDGTNGFRRPGIITFPVPSDWTAAQAPAGQPTGFSIWATVANGTFTYPPRLIRAVPNAVIATNSYRAGRDPYYIDWLPLPARELPLSLDGRNNFDGDGPLERGMHVRLLEIDGVWRKWTATDDLTRHRSFTRKFVVDRERQCLVFGDGYFGRIPHIQTAGGKNNVQWQGWMGGGARGNVGTGLNWETDAGTIEAVNVTATIGGSDPETVEAARTRGAGVVRRITRAVTAADFESLARSAPGVSVARASAALGVNPRHACPVADAVTVYIVPWAPRGPDIAADEFVPGPQADPGTLAAVQKRLQRARLIGTDLFVSSARYRPISVEVTVSGDVRDPVSLEATIREALTIFLDPLVGGGDGSGWPFGEPPRTSAVMRQAQTAAGVGITVSNVSIALEETPAAVCQDVVIGPNDLVWLQQMTLILDRTLTVSGGLR
jgi:hypothetical protein